MARKVEYILMKLSPDRDGTEGTKDKLEAP